MEDANEYVRFLSRKENLRVALQVEEHIKEVKDRMHETFWVLVEEHVGQRLQENEFGAGWGIERRDEYPLTGKHGGLRIVPTNHDERDISVVANIEQRHYEEYRVVYGLWPHRFEKRMSKNYRSVDAELRGQFSDLGFKTDDLNGAPVQALTDCYARSNETLISVAGEKQNGTPGVATDMAERFFDFFAAHRSTLEAMNSRLSG